MKNLISSLGGLSYLGAFVAGIFYPHGLTVPLSVAVLIAVAKTTNFLIASLLATFGAVIGDYIIFKFVKDRLLEEIEDLLGEYGQYFKRLKTSKRFKSLIPVLAGFIMASPLPNELASALFGIAEYKTRKFILFSLIFNFIGIFLIVCLGIII
jgi:uncharacterized membrane protein YdjX (TVP38/TMEM64 family)